MVNQLKITSNYPNISFNSKGLKILFHSILTLSKKQRRKVFIELSKYDLKNML